MALLFCSISRKNWIVFQPELTKDMISIGMLFSGEPSVDANIEDTLLSAPIKGLINRDGRVMSLLTDWLTLHRQKINVDRLTKIVSLLSKQDYRRIIIYWAATAQRFSSDPRFKKLSRLYKKKRMNYFSLFLENKDDYDSEEPVTNFFKSDL